MAAIDDGSSRPEASASGGVPVPSVRDKVVKSNSHGPSGLIDGKPPGQPSRLNAEHQVALVRAIDDGPALAVHSVMRSWFIDARSRSASPSRR